MERLLRDLEKVLSIILNLYNKIYDLQKQQTAVIVAGNIKKLQDIIRQMESIIMELSEWEKARQEVIDDICKQIGKDSKVVTLSYLTSNYSAGEGLLKLQDELENTLKNVADANKLNDSLVKEALEYLNKSVDTIKSAMTQNNGIYSKDVPKENSLSIFDRKV